MEKLHSLQVINYTGQTDKPHLTFIKPRVDTQHLLIDRKYLADRYQVHKSQIEAVINYAESFQCRSQQLLSYFDEADAPECGVCDICLENKRKKRQESITDEIIKELLDVLSNHPMMLSDLVNSIKNGNEKEKLKVIRMLLDASTIKANGEYYYV